MDRKYILGAKEGNEKAVLNIGRYYALDGSLGAPVYLDISKPHVIFLCGKRGYGKSYTIGVLLEEFYSLDEEIRKNISFIVADTLGIFWSSIFPNRKEEEKLERWGIEASGVEIEIFSSPELVNYYRRFGIDAKEILIATSFLKPFHWCRLFGISSLSAEGVAISRAIGDMEGKYSIDDVIEKIRNDDEISKETKLACINFFIMAKNLKIFGKEGINLADIAKKGKISIIDLSAYDESIKEVILSILGEIIFYERIIERKRDEEREMGISQTQQNLPFIWLAIDEAHIFLPKEDKITKDVFIRKWLRQGRQPGLSLILATQRVSSMDAEVLSHADIIICHRLTSQEDIDAMNNVRPTYMRESIGEAIKKMGSEKGVALIVDDITEVSHLVKIRPRRSWHAGGEPAIKSAVKK
ncbi:MAG: ATP-binding protein [Thermoplasmatales archaeon]|nr:ATP-binding protein [Thermoplasmatales archaeon]